VTTKNWNAAFLLFMALIFIFVFAGIILFFRNVNGVNLPPAPDGSEPVNATVTATSIWNALQEATPFAYSTPLPDPVKSSLDGIYSKIDQSWPQWWKCYRCADYRLAGVFGECNLIKASCVFSTRLQAGEALLHLPFPMAAFLFSTTPTVRRLSANINGRLKAGNSNLKSLTTLVPSTYAREI